MPPETNLIVEANRLLAIRSNQPCSMDLKRMINNAIFNARAPELLRLTVNKLHEIQRCEHCQVCKEHKK